MEQQFKVNVNSKGNLQKVQNWQVPPSGMAKTAANAKPDTNIMKRARSFSNNRGFQHPHTQPVENKPIPPFQPPTSKA